MDESEINQYNLPRLFELVGVNGAFAKYLRDTDSQAHIPIKRKVLRDFEEDLSSLDDEAWAFFKTKAQSKSCLEGEYSQKANETPKIAQEKGYGGLHLCRSWQPLFDLRSEVRGYRYLKSIGCNDVRFIPENTGQGQQTPDLRGTLGGLTVLCEVKTINRSDDAVASSFFSLVADEQIKLSDGFFKQISKNIGKSIKQIESYGSRDNTLKIIYFFFDFDDNLGEYIKYYACQLDEIKMQYNCRETEILFDYHPSGYWASP